MTGRDDRAEWPGGMTGRDVRAGWPGGMKQKKTRVRRAKQKTNEDEAGIVTKIFSQLWSACYVCHLNVFVQSSTFEVCHQRDNVLYGAFDCTNVEDCCQIPHFI